MKKRRPLRALQRLAEHAADSASREVGERLRLLRAEEERLRQIGGYLDQYEQLSTRPDANCTLATLQGRRQFAARLREATQRQHEVVVQEEASYQRRVEYWREARARALALQRFNERLREQELERLARAEQHTLDEIALQRRR
jgi:flagellar FliJ protein